MNIELRMCPRNSRIPRTLPAGSGKAPACRTLFGPVDHKLTEKFLEQELSKLFQDSSKDWDFDFMSGLPLPTTRYQWEPIIPEPRTTPKKERDLESSPTNLCSIQNFTRRVLHIVDRKRTDDSSKKKSRVKQSKISNAPKCRSYVQSTLKDYLPVTKRLSLPRSLLPKRKVIRKSCRRRTLRNKELTRIHCSPHFVGQKSKATK